MQSLSLPTYVWIICLVGVGIALSSGVHLLGVLLLGREKENWRSVVFRDYPRFGSEERKTALRTHMDYVTFTIIVDDIVYPDGHTTMACLGGGGGYFWFFW